MELIVGLKATYLYDLEIEVYRIFQKRLTLTHCCTKYNVDLLKLYNFHLK